MRLLTLLVVFAGKGEPLGYAECFMSSKADGIVIPVPTLDLPEDGELSAPCKTARFKLWCLGGITKPSRRGAYFSPRSTAFSTSPHPATAWLSNSAMAAKRARLLPDMSKPVAVCSGREGYRDTAIFTAKPDGTFVDHQLFKLILPR